MSLSYEVSSTFQSISNRIFRINEISLLLMFTASSIKFGNARPLKSARKVTSTLIQTWNAICQTVFVFAILPSTALSTPPTYVSSIPTRPLITFVSTSTVTATYTFCYTVNFYKKPKLVIVKRIIRKLFLTYYTDTVKK